MIPIDPVTGLPQQPGRRVRPAGGPGPGVGGGYSSPLPFIPTPAGMPPLNDPGSGVPAAPSTTNLQQLIENDPLYRQAQADIAAAQVGDRSSLAAARQRALIQYGQVPDFLKAAGSLGLVGSDIGSDITDTIRRLAQSNTQAGLSTLGRLQQAYQDNVRSVRDNLTARGILSSGETPFQLNRQFDQLNGAKSEALQQLIDTLAGYHNAYLTGDQQRHQQLLDAMTAAAGRVPPGTAATDPASSPLQSILAGPGQAAPPPPPQPATMPALAPDAAALARLRHGLLNGLRDLGY